jgi:DNA-binding transcriptional ArsR family regulator
VNAGIRIVVHSGGTTLEIDGESATARRDLGAVAWSILEALALASAEDHGVWSATTNARELARRLDIGKDRAAAALSTLRRAGLVVAHTNREATTSRFAASHYEVRLPISNVEAAPDPVPHPRRPAPSRSRTRDASTPEPLDLFSTTP